MIPQDEKNVMELTGGLKNALERGESLEKSMESLINAGYNKKEVLEASKRLRITHEGEETSQQEAKKPKEKPKEEQIKKPKENLPKKTLELKAKPLPEQKIIKKTKKKRKPMSSRLLWILTILFSIFILVGAAILGLFWDRWFS